MKEAFLASSQDSRRNDWRYAAPPGFWDEAMLSSGVPRRHWRNLVVAIGRMGFRQFNRAWQTGQQLIQAEGIRYNVGSDSYEQPWPMDPIPLVLAEDEWPSIERAVAQRATLLNAMLADLYGEQRLIREHGFPPALLFANPQFLRPCMGIRPSDGAHLRIYAADLARSPDGRWWVIADRAQAPSGMGYTLVNRLLSARTLPNVFQQCRVRQLARFFDLVRDALIAQSVEGGRQSRIVLLTPGAHNETYFEHSFLAGYWGFALVEGGDLTVRDGRVFLKTLAGLEPVDRILRRMDDSFCDPLELRGDSLLGVPGLVQAARNGAVAVHNSLGSGLIETPAHMAFLPGLCRVLLDEDLLMPSVATWWCGQQEPLRYVREHLSQLVLKPAFPENGFHPLFPEWMDTDSKENLANRIEEKPERFVAQERVALSTAPVFTETGLASRHIVLRVYAAWDGQSYAVLPGGLTRFSTEESSLMVSMQLGGGSKDTWVLGGQVAAQPRAPQISVTAYPKGGLPSRVADNLFWLGRYMERVEATLRLMRALLPALSSEEDFGRSASLETAIHFLIGLRYLPRDDAEASIGEQWWGLQRLLTDMVYDPSRTSSLGWNFKELRRVSWQVRERLSADTWRVLQQLEAELSRVAPTDPNQRYFGEAHALDNAILTLSAFSGLLMENTTRGFGWRFLEIGRRLERALQTLDLLSSGVAEAHRDVEPYLQVLLQIADSSITYRARFLSVVRPDLVLQLLLADEGNPRSVAFQLVSLLSQVDRLQEDDPSSRDLLERPLALQALTAVRNAPPDDLFHMDEEKRLPQLGRLLHEVRTVLYQFSDALTADYLSHLTASRLTASL